MPWEESRKAGMAFAEGLGEVDAAFYCELRVQNHHQGPWSLEPCCPHVTPTPAATEAAVKGCGREIASLWKLQVEKTQTQDEHTDATRAPGTAGLCLGEVLDGAQATAQGRPRLQTHQHLLWAGQQPEVETSVHLCRLDCCVSSSWALGYKLAWPQAAFFHEFWGLNSGPRCAAGLSTEPSLHSIAIHTVAQAGLDLRDLPAPISWCWPPTLASC